MRYVTELPFGARPCPISNKSLDDGFFGPYGVVGVDPNFYLSFTVAREMARQLGWVPPEVHEETVGRIHELELENQTLQDELDQTDGYLDAIDVLASRGFVERKRPGRPKTAAKEAA